MTGLGKFALGPPHDSEAGRLLRGGAHVTYDTVTNAVTLNQALRATRAGGQVVMLGLAGMAEGVDWTPTEAAAPGAKALVRVEWPERFVAGSRHDLAIVVENPSQAPIHRVVVRSKATLDLFDHREWVFGKIMPRTTTLKGI